MNTARRNNRKFLSFSDAQLQKEFIGFVVFVTLSSIALMLVGTYYMVERFATLAAELPAANETSGAEMYTSIQHVWWMMIAAAIVICVCNAIVGFWFSTRFSGIIFRLTKDLNRLADGEQVTKIVPRDGDFFIPMVDAVNRIIEKQKA